MKTLVVFLLTVLALPVVASTTILSGVLYRQDTGFLGGYGPGQGTFSLSLEGTTLTYAVSSAGSPSIGLAAPALTLALASGDVPLSFTSAASLLGSGCFFYSFYTPLSIRWEGSGLPEQLPLVRPLPVVDCDVIFSAALYRGSAQLTAEQIQAFNQSGFQVTFSASFASVFAGDMPITEHYAGLTDTTFYSPVPEPSAAILGLFASCLWLAKCRTRPNTGAAGQPLGLPTSSMISSNSNINPALNAHCRPSGASA